MGRISNDDFLNNTVDFGEVIVNPATNNPKLVSGFPNKNGEQVKGWIISGGELTRFNNPKLWHDPRFKSNPIGSPVSPVSLDEIYNRLDNGEVLVFSAPGYGSIPVMKKDGKYKRKSIVGGYVELTEDTLQKTLDVNGLSVMSYPEVPVLGPEEPIVVDLSRIEYASMRKYFYENNDYVTVIRGSEKWIKTRQGVGHYENGVLKKNISNEEFATSVSKINPDHIVIGSLCANPVVVDPYTRS